MRSDAYDQRSRERGEPGATRGVRDAQLRASLLQIPLVSSDASSETANRGHWSNRSAPMKTTAALRRLLAARDIVIAPGAYDAITARLIEQAGYPAVYMTGAGSSAARGFPDFGLLTMSEMVENARVLARSITIPLISDADTGYGNELNVTRSVREFEAVG